MCGRGQLERIMSMDRKIRAGEYPNAHSIAEEFDLKPRVIYDDRAFMKNRLRAPIAYDRKRHGWYYTDTAWVLPSAFVTQGEMLAFFLSVEVARRYLGTALEAPLKSAVQKITQGLESRVEVDLDSLRQHYTFAAPPSLKVDERILAMLDGAIQTQRQVRMRYFTAARGEHTERTVDPHHLRNVGGDWYLLAFDDASRQMRTFHVGRIEEWQQLDTGFTFQPDFDVEAWRQTAFQAEATAEQTDVVVRFDAYQARYIRERHWHDSQQIEELPDGGLLLRLHTGGLGQVQRWVMQYGNHAEVLEPPELRAAVQNEVRGMRERYDQ
ncbi:MAG: WYL domain-containing protein [Abitibacteriaceae bacterium]|nr:WYL domain-containing protein [Abditibacteriaceae bacterium]MBV9865233.1 WYL domain-containing protein [Abditibacteriaceae bacterium]